MLGEEQTSRGLRAMDESGAKATSANIPQIFVGERHIGGCTETFDAFNDGRLQALLHENGATFKQAGYVDAYSFLPKWLHPR